MNVDARQKQQIEGPMWKCQQCYGFGKTERAGCSLEHGISTSCEAFGCLPVSYVECTKCGGNGKVVMPPTFKTWIGLQRHQEIRLATRRSSEEPFDSSHVRLGIRFDADAGGYVASVNASPRPIVEGIRLRDTNRGLRGEQQFEYLGRQHVARASVELASIERIELTIDVVTAAGHSIWTCRTQL
jgi:hypothetical protein